MNKSNQTKTGVVSGVLVLLIISVVAGVAIEFYGVFLTFTVGEAHRWGSEFYNFEIFIRWATWIAGVLAVVYVAFTSRGFVKILGILGGIIFIANIVVRVVIPQTHYSEHVFNGLTILGLALAIYKDVKESL